MAFVIYHQINKRNRALDKVREYGRRLRDDLSHFVAEKEAAVKDYAVALGVQQKAAKELLKRLVLTDEEMTAKAEAVARLDERIGAYEATLDELDRMTDRVQENLNRLRDESNFVENAAKRVAWAEDKLKTVERGLQDVERRFARENAQNMEKSVEALIGPLRSTVVDLQVTAEGIARKVEEHRGSIDAVERHRETILARDMELINKTLKNVVEQAGARADKLEEAALAKLRDQAMDRIHRYQNSLEEKLKDFQESTKSRIAEVQGLQRIHKDEIKKDAALQEEKLDAQEKRILTMEERCDDLIAGQGEKIRSFEHRTAEMVEELEKQFHNAAQEAKRRAMNSADEVFKDYQAAQEEQFQRLEALADDTVRMDQELRRYIDSRRKTAEEEFNAQITGIKEGVNGLGTELAALKQRAYDNVSEKLGAFEEEFTADLSKRGDEISRRLTTWKQNLDGDLAKMGDQARDAAEDSIKSEVSRLTRSMEEWQAKFDAQIQDTNAAIDSLRGRSQELSSESDEQLREVRRAIEDADRRIKEFVDQTKLFEQAEALKQKLERRMEDLQSDIAKIDQRKAEVAELETQFVKIKRLEDEVNAKMTRFLSEKRRIELMENDFNRLLQTSQAVEEKLAQVTASDDTIQAVQVQIRKLSDALADTEDQYQRLEKKNQTLETTNAGIDRNFRTLQEAEEDIKRFTGELDHITQEQEKLQSSLERLAGESEKAQTAAEKISLLSDELPSIEKRIESIQVAREWLARTETRLTALDKDIQDRLKLLGDIMKDESGKPKIKGSPPIGTRESVVKLARQGWKVDEIARAVKLSRSEVELILEINPKD
ncbi:MAG: hypothetical protein LBG76_07025 [Treponema sp.]|nr:hypothetical protein [Treponema sp.]